MSEVLVAARELEREYRVGPETVRVLRGVTLAVSAGESVALIGASGVGKSTLLHLLGGLDHPTAGQVLFAGEDMYARSESALARLRRTEIAFIFQFYNLLGEMTALENAMMPALLQQNAQMDRLNAENVRLALAFGGLRGSERRKRATDLLERVGLIDRMDHRPAELSGGEQQRVAIARALVAEPRLVLADEPTGNLDPKTSEVIWELFLKLQAERGLAFVIATHNHDLARKADHGYRLVEGRAIAWS